MQNFNAKFGKYSFKHAELPETHVLAWHHANIVAICRAGLPQMK